MVRFFTATHNRIRVFDLKSGLFRGDKDTYIPVYQFDAPESISAMAVSTRTHGAIPAFALTYQGVPGVDIVSVRGSKEDELVVEKRLFAATPSRMDVCTCLLWNTDSDILVFGDDQGYIHLCHITTGRDISQLKMGLKPVREVRMLSLSCYISCDGSESVSLWDLRDRTTIMGTLKVPPTRFSRFTARPVMGMNVSGCLAVCADVEGRATVWDTRNTTKPLSTHFGEIHSEPHPSRSSTASTGVCLAGNFVCLGVRNSTLSLYHRESTYPVCYHRLGKGAAAGTTIGRLEYSTDAKRVIAADSCGNVGLLTIQTEVPDGLTLPSDCYGT